MDQRSWKSFEKEVTRVLKLVRALKIAADVRSHHPSMQVKRLELPC